MKRVLIICVILVGLVASLYIFGGKVWNEEKSVAHNNSESVKNPSVKPLPPEKDRSQLVNEIVEQAKIGKILDAPFQLGITTIEEIRNEWGEPRFIDETAVGNFANYPDRHVTIGIHDSRVFDIRSYHNNLQKIRLGDIKNTLGEPDEVRFYQDETYDQIIFIYQVHTTYQLKWILPKKSEMELNPQVHHISVVSENDVVTNGKWAQLLNEMSLDEKIGQMIFAGMEGTELGEEMKSIINKYKVGGVIFNGYNLKSSEQTVTYINQIKQLNESNSIPLFFGIDQEGGRISKLPGDLLKFPTNLAIGQQNNPALSFEVGTVLGQQLKAFGFNINFAPVLDVNSNPNNPVIGDRSFSNNPEIVARLGIATMEGLKSQQIISTVKHFPGHGDTTTDSHLELPVINKPLEDLQALELIPFQKAIDAGAEVVMIAHILLPEIDSIYPSSMSKIVITDLLREQMNFDGIIMTDDFTMKAITNHYELGEAAVLSVQAGSDIIMVAHDYEKVIHTFKALKNAVLAGEILEERINESVERILRLKEKYDLNNSVVGDVNIDVLNGFTQEVFEKYGVE